MNERSLAQAIVAALDAQRGVVRARPAIVHRDTYTGRGVLGKNVSYATGAVDERGYLPVEWWILSTTEARNNVLRAGEGITALVLPDGPVPLPRALDAAGGALFGDARERWPLIKILDIGGEPVVPDFADEAEVPPIPVHVHGGDVIDGRARKPGKREAYFFPPLDVLPNTPAIAPVRTRLGLRPGVTREEFTAALGDFGVSDRMYTLLAAFDVAPLDGWTIAPGIVHAPGPWPTVEVQTPQDDYNLAAWQLGRRLKGAELESARERFLRRGLADDASFVRELVDWKLSSGEGFRERAYRPARLLDEGAWGRCWRTFFEHFQGEAFAIAAGRSRRFAASDEPRALFAWSGAGAINGMRVGAADDGEREVLLAPGHELVVEAERGADLWLFSFGPMRG